MQKPHSGIFLSHAFFCLKDALKNEKELSDQSLVCSSACTQVPPGHSCGSSGQTIRGQGLASTLFDTLDLDRGLGTLSTNHMCSFKG